MFINLRKCHLKPSLWMLRQVKHSTFLENKMAESNFDCFIGDQTPRSVLLSHAPSYLYKSQTKNAKRLLPAYMFLNFT